MSLSAPVRVAAIVGAFVLLGGGYFVLGPGKPSTPTVQHTLIRHPHVTAGSTKTKASGVPGEETAPSAAPTKSKATVHAAAKPAPKPKPKPVQLAPGLPDVLAAALRQRAVVVVAVVNPQAPDDEIAREEAAAGAALSGAGFVALDVLDQDQIAPLTRALGVVDDPAVLVYRRPGRVIGQLNGYADKETVAQAVANAAPDLVAPVDHAVVAATPTSWVDEAAAACTAFHTSQSKKQPAAALLALPGALSVEIARLKRVQPPAAVAGTYNRLLGVLDTMHSDAQSLTAAINAGNQAQTATFTAALRSDDAKATALARQLGLKACIR
jgi:hypothetical protein